MKNFMSDIEKLGDEDFLLPILDKLSDKIVLLTTIVGIPCFFYLLFQFSYSFL
ncbi:hypothetical protein [Sutcliffiella rhizosphaerae]|uniref:Uncharacterized protein n=1 Tax=Sutcliffiella rhizosphaerae TaxID=2880967 RepID=A0ABN8ADZ5_9BACI|nr:hypothetical protein [Sutcliffiella rhizosphaerae]CAG9621957.1 hypothetical protein BACCIP111883_02748 [Sutcliffiella rhizosphaerae]